MDQELLHFSLKEQRTGSVSVRSHYWQFYWCDLEKKNPKIEKTYFCSQNVLQVLSIPGNVNREN